MAEDVNIAFHAGQLLKNPAWRRGVDEARAQLARERDALAWEDPRRHYVTIAESLLTKLERRFVQMTQTGKVEQFNRQQRDKIA